MRKKEKKITVLLMIAFFTGIALLLYPAISDYWNSFHQTKAITSYSETVSELKREDYDNLLQQATDYNRSIADRKNTYELSETERVLYNSMLDVSGTGVMGYLQIPVLDLQLPIYHGTDETVLQVAIGHLEWTSLPVGGEGTHCVLSGHRGLPSAKLFSNLDKLAQGDVFMLYVLDEVLTYEVDQILTVEPMVVSDLQVEEGKDYCTLLTCTPYGVNSHRLLVRGHRVENSKAMKAVRITSEAIQVEEILVASVLAVPVLAVMITVVYVVPGRKRRRPF